MPPQPNLPSDAALPLAMTRNVSFSFFPCTLYPTRKGHYYRELNPSSPFLCPSTRHTTTTSTSTKRVILLPISYCTCSSLPGLVSTAALLCWPYTPSPSVVINGGFDSHPQLTLLGTRPYCWHLYLQALLPLDIATSRCCYWHQTPACSSAWAVLTVYVTSREALAILCLHPPAVEAEGRSMSMHG